MKRFFEVPSVTWYRGSNTDHLKLGGNGNNTQQYGCGLYFAEDENSASAYGKVKSFKISTSKGFITDKKRTDYKLVEYLIKNAPNLEDSLTNWDENPKKALRQAIQANCDHPNMIRNLIYIQNDFYRDEDDAYMENCIKYGISGLIVQANIGRFLILYDLTKVKVLAN